MSELIRLAVVGLGAVAKKHINAILKFATRLKLVAVVDSEVDRIRNYLKIPGVAGFTQLKEMLEQSSVDIVVICTPSGLHARQTLQCIDYGKHVLVEKPMSVSWQDGLAVQAAVQNAKIHLWVVHQHRANPALQLLKKAIDGNDFGSIFQISVNIFWTRSQSYYDAGAWRGSRSLDGGALMNQASHYVDLLHWLFGPIQAIQAMSATQARQIETEDSCVLNLRWQQGFLGSLSLSTLVYPKNLEASITVVGAKGTVKLSGLSSQEIVHWEFSDNKVTPEKLRQTNEEAQKFIEDSHYYYYTYLLETLAGKVTFLPDVNAGLKTLEILVAAQQAAEQQITVNLPLCHG